MRFPGAKSLIAKSGLPNCGPRPATPGRAMRHERDAVRRQRRLPCSWSRGDERWHALRIAAPWWCGPGRRSRVPATRERSAHERTPSPSASMGCDDPGCGIFPKRLSSAAQEKIRGGCLAPRIISHRCNGSSATPEAARKSLCLDCGTGCRSGPPLYKHENACRCAYHVQRASLLCKSRGKTGRYSTAGETSRGLLHGC